MRRPGLGPGVVRSGGPGSGRLVRVTEPATSSRPRRVLLKLSGEALMGSQRAGVDMAQVRAVAEQVALLRSEGSQVAVVVGGGNFLRGASQAELGMDRATGDYMGMLATILNALPLQDGLEAAGVPTRVMSALPVHEVAEPYVRAKALHHLDKDRVVVFAGGTGNPFFTTDTAAALRSLEVGADALLMGKNGVRGVFDRDPNGPDGANARFLEEVTYQDALVHRLKVMDAAAFALLAEHEVPIHVFDMDVSDAIPRIARGERLGTLVHAAAPPIDR
ncbi:MAG: kinase [Thermoleophilia bacterium]|nr:kinase [Thermoleophilia bacterium]